jgi:hypothetical protein
MNYIEVSGGTARKRELAEAMVNFCIKKFMPRMRTLDIQVKIKDLKQAAKGYCLAVDKRTFELEIEKNMTQAEFMRTVAHEMVHVKQYARNELHVEHDKCWKNDFYTNTNYWELPWEIEAHGREIGLFVMWCQTHGKDFTPGKWMER